MKYALQYSHIQFSLYQKNTITFPTRRFIERRLSPMFTLTTARVPGFKRTSNPYEQRECSHIQRLLSHVDLGICQIPRLFAYGARDLVSFERNRSVREKRHSHI